MSYLCPNCGRRHDNEGFGTASFWDSFFKGERFCSSRCKREYEGAKPKSDAEVKAEAEREAAKAGCIAKIVVTVLVIGAIFVAVSWVNRKIDAYKARKAHAAQVLREASESVDRMIESDEAEAKRKVNEMREALAREREIRAEKARQEAERLAAEEKRLAAEAEAASKVAEEEAKKKERFAAVRAFVQSEAPTTWKAMEAARAEAATQDRIVAEKLKAHGGKVVTAETDAAYLDALRRRNSAVLRIRLAEEAVQDAFRASVRLKANPKDAQSAREKTSSLARAAAVFSQDGNADKSK